MATCPLVHGTRTKRILTSLVYNKAPKSCNLFAPIPSPSFPVGDVFGLSGSVARLDYVSNPRGIVVTAYSYSSFVGVKRTYRNAAHVVAMTRVVVLFPAVWRYIDNFERLPRGLPHLHRGPRLIRVLPYEANRCHGNTGL